jgi:hypothetical protein
MGHWLNKMRNYEPPLSVEGASLMSLDEIYRGVRGYAIETKDKLIFIPVIETTHEGSGAVGEISRRNLNSLPHSQRGKRPPRGHAQAAQFQPHHSRNRRRTGRHLGAAEGVAMAANSKPLPTAPAPPANEPPRGCSARSLQACTIA